MENKHRSRILIIGSKGFFVDGLVSILDTSPVAGTVTTVETSQPCMHHFVNECPDVLLLQQDARPAPIERFVRELAGGFGDMKILVFGHSMPDEFLYRIVRAGAHGYFNERMSGKHVVEAITAVSAGGYWVERHIMQRFIPENAIRDVTYSRVQELGDRLTVRESEVLELILKGLSTAEIAETIYLSHQGVKVHLTSLFRKFNVKNRSQLILHVLNEVSPVDDITGLLQLGLQANRAAENYSKAG